MNYGPNKWRQATRLDWRWMTACDLTQFDAVAASAKLTQLDAHVRDAYLFKRASDQGLPFDEERLGPLVTAHELFTTHQAERTTTECLLVSGFSAEQCSDRNVGGASLEPIAIQAYADVFFDVQPLLDQGKTTALVNLLFGGSPYHGLSARDQHGRNLRMSWLMGWPLYRAHLQGRPFSEEEMDLFKELMRDLAYKMGYLNLQTMTGRGELDIQVVNLAFDDINKVTKKVGMQAGGKQGQQELLHEMGLMVMDTFRTLSPSVADPMKTSNLTLSAREPRALELSR